MGCHGVLEALAAITDDPLSADALMTAARPDVGGRSSADAFAEDDVDAAVTLITPASDQS